MTVRWLLHPLTTAIALAGAALVVVAVPGRPGGVVVLLVAGAAAGFANSGST